MSNPEAHAASPAASEKRQPRQSRLVKASLGCERLGRFDVTIRNVSKTGVGGKGPHRLHIGERVTLFMPGHQPMRSEEHTSELQSLMRISYAVFCLKKKKKKRTLHIIMKKVRTNNLCTELQ